MFNIAKTIIKITMQGSHRVGANPFLEGWNLNISPQSGYGCSVSSCLIGWEVCVVGLEGGDLHPGPEPPHLGGPDTLRGRGASPGRHSGLGPLVPCCWSSSISPALVFINQPVSCSGSGTVCPGMPLFMNFRIWFFIWIGLNNFF
jgi:hypothetical protein